MNICSENRIILIMTYVFPPQPHESSSQSNLRRSLSNGTFPLGFPTKILYEFLISPICATCLAHNILFYLIVLIIFGQQYKL
jgi:hypothetical protein